MLTPVFECSQDGQFVIVRIKLSAICKALEAVFDINGSQFTFHCRPYYLRLKFNELLCEGKGERATYDLETNTLTVFLPKEQEGQEFTQLDNVGYLIATDRQRAQLLGVQGATEEQEILLEEEDAEYVQQLPSLTSSASNVADEMPVNYGFADNFSGLFKNVDEDIVSEMVSVPCPETTLPAERREMRLLKENHDFDEEAVLLCFEDAEGEVTQLLKYVPAHVRDFQHALQSDKVVYAAVPTSDSAAAAAARTRNDALEEEETTLLPGDGRPVDIWAGNVADFKRPLIEVMDGDAASLQQPQQKQPEDLRASSDAVHVLPPTRLAIPKRRPQITFTAVENEALIRMRLPRLLFPPDVSRVAALTVDLLLSDGYDDIFTEGTGCSESVWTLCALSPSLAYLDAPETAYDAAVFFARRALVYPLQRHFALVQRVFASVGTRLLLGRQYVVRALLRMRDVLSHSEHKHVLSTIFLDPLIGYWMNQPNADEHLARIALELHEHVARTQPLTVVVASKNSSGPTLMLSSAQTMRRTVQPITLLTLGLPFE